MATLKQFSFTAPTFKDAPPVRYTDTCALREHIDEFESCEFPEEFKLWLNTCEVGDVYQLWSDDEYPGFVRRERDWCTTAVDAQGFPPL